MTCIVVAKPLQKLLLKVLLNHFFQKKNCNIATVRSGNCIGGGDWTKDRIVKDCAESFLKNKRLIIRSPNATRPWQHVIEPLFGYLNLSKKLYLSKKFIGSWNFGPKMKNSLKVKEVAFFGKKMLNSKSKILVKKNKYYESTNLSLNSSKSRRLLKWKTFLTAKESLRLSFDWYKFYHESRSKSQVINYTLKQIKTYKKKLKHL